MDANSITWRHWNGVRTLMDEPSYGDVVINEILFKVSSQSNAEFVELYNVSEMNVAVSRLAIQIGNGRLLFLEHTHDDLGAGDYLLISGDGALTLDNYPFVREEVIVATALPALRDGGNNISLWYKQEDAMLLLDEVSYTQKWHQPGLVDDRDVSLERINPYQVSDETNWSSCLNMSWYATPSLSNSIYSKKEIPMDVAISYSSVVSPNGDGHQDEFFVKIGFPYPNSRYSVEIIDGAGQVIERLRHNQPIVFEEELRWEGVQRLSDGHYFVQIEIISDSGKKVRKLKPFAVIR